MKNDDLYVIVNIPNGKEGKIDETKKLAKEYKGSFTSSKVTDKGNQLRFDFKNASEKNSFFDSIPVDWL